MVRYGHGALVVRSRYGALLIRFEYARVRFVRAVRCGPVQFVAAHSYARSKGAPTFFTCVYTVPVIKKLKYLTASTVIVLFWYCFSSTVLVLL